MKFIIPQNYNLNTKLFGIIEYTAAIIDLIWCGIVYIIINFLFKSISIKIFIFIATTFPIIIFSIVGVNGENFIYYFTYIIKYFLKQKIYLYDKK